MGVPRYNMKQLNFRHFNTNSKKFFETVNFFQKEAKTASKRPILFCLVFKGVFGHFTTISDYFRRFPKTTDDSRRKRSHKVMPQRFFSFASVVNSSSVMTFKRRKLFLAHSSGKIAAKGGLSLTQIRC